MVSSSRIISEFMALSRIDRLSKREREAVHFVTGKLTALGLEVYQDQAHSTFGGEAGNVIAVLPGNNPGFPPVMFCAHLDVVEPGSGIEPVVEDGIITSKGETVLGADDGAGVVAILEALRCLIDSGTPHGDIEVVFTVAEEVGLLGSKGLERERLRSRFGFILDSGGHPGEIILQGPAQDSLEATFFGRAAHAGSNPQEGINAIQMAARAIARMNLGRVDEETTANIGVIQGGRATNIIPDRVELKGEARSQQEDQLNKQVLHMQGCLEKAAQEFGGRVEIRIERQYPPFRLDPSEEPVHIASKAAREIGIEPRLKSSGGGSDANILNGYGIKCVNLGLGMQKVHTTEEHIAVQDLVRAAEYVLALIKNCAVSKA